MKKMLFFITLLFGLLTAQQREWYDYPLDNSAQPLTLRVNWVILQRDDGTGNFNMNDPEEAQLFQDFMTTANNAFMNIQRPDANDTKCYQPGADFMPDTKIRLQSKIVVIRNTFAWNYLNSGSDAVANGTGWGLGMSPGFGFYLKPIEDSLNASLPKGEKAVNIFFPVHGGNFDYVNTTHDATGKYTSTAGGQFPDSDNLQRSSAITWPDSYLKYIYQRYVSTVNYGQPWIPTVRNWTLGDYRAVLHELGHNLDLNHSNEYHDTYSCGSSVMSYAPGDRNYLEPTEIKKMHWTLTNTNMMQFVTAKSYYGTTVQITRDTNWSKQRRYYSNFELAAGRTLTISSTVTLPPQAFVKLNAGSRIVITKTGRLQDAYGNKFVKFHTARAGQVIWQK